MNNQHYKRRLDTYISHDSVFTERDKQKVFQKIKELSNEPVTKKRNTKFLFAKYVGPIVLALLMVGIVGFLLQNLSQNNLEEKSVTEKEYEFPSAEIIQNKVNELIENFELGMTHEQVKETFGEDYISGEAQNPEGEPFSYWTYYYYKNPNITGGAPIPGDIDIQNLGQKHVGIEFSIFWRDKKVLFATVAYRTSENIKVMEFKRDGDISEYTVNNW
ncbi:hypothetical protein [Radiobacillus deserti]|uniref:Uncharacterized protein n=1 Tax=Radiobacillus deserti TaxID=2594883 RepID=A0A516KDQ9_9BACI|nr:hypothetical protein [Radiobacillus deserti]QDP39544.1 hypothetical protein FN924_04740 [Radiobacillus deserti]